jgi:hypothetical protein
LIQQSKSVGRGASRSMSGGAGRSKVGIHGDIIAALQGVVGPAPVDDTGVCFIGRGCSRVRSADVGVEPSRTFI